LNVIGAGTGTGEQSGAAIWPGSSLELIGLVVDDNPAERLSPPIPQGARVVRVDDRLLPLPDGPQIIPPYRVEPSGNGTTLTLDNVTSPDWRRQGRCLANPVALDGSEVGRVGPCAYLVGH